MKREVKTLDEFITALNDIVMDAFKEECSKEEHSKETSCKSTCDSSCSEDEKETCGDDITLHLSDSVISIDNDTYFLKKSVDDKKLNEEIMLNFAHKCDCGDYVPGITEMQLLTVLLYRNRTNPERYNKIKSLLL